MVLETDWEEALGSELVPGLGIGPVALGARFADVRAALGEPVGTPAVLSWLGLARYPGLELELLVSSSLEDAVSPDALVIGVATTGSRYGGALRPGRTRAALEAALGRPPDGGRGGRLLPGGRGDRVRERRRHARRGDGGLDPCADAAGDARVDARGSHEAAGRDRAARGGGGGRARVAVDGRMLEVVDMHPGAFGQMAPLGKRFVIESLPEYLRLYAPAVVGRSIDPWAPHIGIRAQTALAGVDHVLLLAVYTQHTTGGTPTRTSRACSTMRATLAGPMGWPASISTPGR